MILKCAQGNSESVYQLGLKAGSLGWGRGERRGDGSPISDKPLGVQWGPRRRGEL